MLLQLRVRGKTLRVGQVCDGVLYLRETLDLPPTLAKLLITVNGKKRAYSIYLPHGIGSESSAVPYF